MIVCEYCLEAIESHEGKQIKKEFESQDGETKYGYIDDDGNFVEDDDSWDEWVWCEWCEDWHLVEECWVI